MAPFLLEALRDDLARGQVVVVVGAGVSLSGCPSSPVASWPGLLTDGVRRCEQLLGDRLPASWAERVLAQIGSGDLEELLLAAENVARRLGGPAGGEYRRWLRESIGELHVEQPAVLEALRDLAAPLMTTNYDGLLEEVTGRPPITWRDAARAQRVVRGDEPGVLHLHGYWEEPGSVVLGIRTYEAVLNDAHAQAMQQALAGTRTLLFVGFGAGLEDPNFHALRSWMARLFASSEYRHYRLCLANEQAALAASHGDDERVVVLSYGNDHNELASFLRSLASSGGTGTARDSGDRHASVPDPWQELVRHWPMPRVVDANPYELGVLHSARANRYARDGQRPPYVTRIRDADLNAALTRSNFVLVAGRSHAGKSRTAFEAACAAVPEYLLVVPRSRTALEELSTTPIMGKLGHPVLIWQDDLDRYLGPDGLDAMMLSRWSRCSLPVKVLGTIRVGELARLRKTSGEAGREIRLVVDQAKRVVLEPRLQGPERAEAERLYPGERFDAGLGEHLAAAHELVQKFNEGVEDCPEGYAVVMAAVSWRRVGLDAIPISALKALYELHLKQLQPWRRTSDQDFETGLAWAIAKEVGAAALLLPSESEAEARFQVSDYIVDYVERGGVE